MTAQTSPRVSQNFEGEVPGVLGCDIGLVPEGQFRTSSEGVVSYGLSLGSAVNSLGMTRFEKLSSGVNKEVPSPVKTRPLNGYKMELITSTPRSGRDKLGDVNY